MSFDKLKGKMVEAHVSQAKLSEKLGITVQSLNAKLNGRTQFTLEEAVRITEFLNLKDPIDIFFDPSRPKNATKDRHTRRWLGVKTKILMGGEVGKNETIMSSMLHRTHTGSKLLSGMRKMYERTGGTVFTVCRRCASNYSN